MSGSLADLLDELLDAGAVVHGDVTISLAGVDLVSLDLRLLLCSVLTLGQGGEETADQPAGATIASPPPAGERGGTGADGVSRPSGRGAPA